MSVSRNWQSCIYQGRVRHRRFEPIPHSFSYPTFLMYLDLSEIEVLFQSRWLWSLESCNLAQFRRRDHLKARSGSLSSALKALVCEKTGSEPEGPIRLLTHLRYFGYCFNPVSFYYCFDRDDRRVETIVAEVNNTPWGEQHCYVLPASSQESCNGLKFEFSKDFHVSPFMPMNLDYRWQFNRPGRSLSVHMANLRHDKIFFAATLVLRRTEISSRSLTSALLRFPFITGQVIAAIYWNAFLLWFKGSDFYSHPDKVGTGLSR